jgi:PD-(D/E)XK nuclease superfamily
MDEDPEPGKLPAAADEALERLLSREDRISDLIAFLAALGLPIRQARVRREVRLSDQAGNADLVVSDEAGPVALLEIKASAAQHGNQFKRYDAWAKDRTPPARCYLIALDGESLGAPSGWVTEPSLPRLVRSWQDSSNPHVAWLASAAADIFEGWITQADGKLGSAIGPIVGDLVARRMESALLDVSSHPGILTRATRQSGGGAAMVLAWLPFPGQPPHVTAWLCADFRSTARDRPAAPWMLRLGVEAEPSDQASAAQARATAHNLAMTILDMLTCTAVQQALRQSGEEDLAACLRPPTRHTRRAPQGTEQAGTQRVADERHPTRRRHPAPGPIS